MSTWRRKIFEDFPEFGLAPETWSVVNASSQLGSMLEGAISSENTALTNRVVMFLLWCDAQVTSDEQFVYFVEDALSTTVRQAPLRRTFLKSLDELKFGRLARYIEYNTSAKIVLEAAETVRLEGRQRR
jgi:hypothetical protein